MHVIIALKVSRGGGGVGEGRYFQGSDLKLSLERGVRINRECSGQCVGRP